MENRMLVVRLQNNWTGLVNMRHSTYAIAEEQQDAYIVDITDGHPLLVCDKRIMKAAMNRVVYNEIYVRSERGICWMFDAVVCLLVSKESYNTTLVNTWKSAISDYVMTEMKSRNNKIREVYNVVNAMEQAE